MPRRSVWDGVEQGDAGGLASPVGPTDGGTGIVTFAKGDLLYASAADVWARIAAGTVGHVLKQGASSVPGWAAESGGGGGGGEWADKAFYTEQQGNNTNAGGSLSGYSGSSGSNLRLLNTTTIAPSGSNIGALTSNGFTLANGPVYHLEITAPVFKSNNTKLFLWKKTATAALWDDEGTNHYIGTPDTVTGLCTMRIDVDMSGEGSPLAFEVHHYVAASQSNNGLGTSTPAAASPLGGTFCTCWIGEYA